jgi:hypothetical protein
MGIRVDCQNAAFGNDLPLVQAKTLPHLPTIDPALNKHRCESVESSRNAISRCRCFVDPLDTRTLS